MSGTKYKSNKSPARDNATNNKGRNNSYRGRKGRNSKEANKTQPELKDVINDIEWYSKNPQLMKDAASLPFSQMLGLPMNFGSWGADATNYREALPGLTLLPVVPSFGCWSDTSQVSTSSRGSINVAAENLYTYVRHQNSGHSNYDASDLMVYIAAMDQVYSYHAELARLYGVARFYSGFNRYLGKYIVEAMDYDYYDIISNLSRLRYVINTMAAKMSTFAVPAIFPMFERHRNIYSSIYMDQASVKAQIYAFTPYVRGIYNEPVDAEGQKIRYKAGLKAKVIGYDYPTLRTVDDIEESIEEMLSPLLHSEDIGIMSGDILKAYGAEKCYHANALPEDWQVGPVFVPVVLKQIHNAVTIGAPIFHPDGNDSMLMWQTGTSPIIYTWDKSHSQIQMFYNSETAPGNAVKSTKIPRNPHLLDTDLDSPTPEEVMEITRLFNLPEDVTGSTTGTMPFAGATTVPILKNEMSFKGMGADAVVVFRVFDPNADNVSNRPYAYNLGSHTIVKDSDEGDLYSTYRYAVSLLSKFNWHPTLYEYGIKSQWNASVSFNMNYVNIRITSNLDNCITVEPNTVSRIHEVALLSLLDVPTATLSRGI